VVTRGRTLVGEADFSAGPAHDETVSSFGRDDGSLVPGEKNRQRQRNGNGNGNATAMSKQRQSRRRDGSVRRYVAFVVTRFGLEQAECGRCVRGEKRGWKGDRYFVC
jgi:hypothetical protein